MTNYRILDRLLKQTTKQVDKSFSKYKSGGFDEVNIMKSTSTKKVTRTVNRTKGVKKLYKEVDDFLFMIWLLLLEKYYGKHYTYKSSPKWFKQLFTDSNPVTMVTYETEILRKRDRLIEALMAIDESGKSPSDANKQVDTSEKELLRFIGWQSILVADECDRQKMKADGVTKVQWLTEEDERVCDECWPLDKQVFDIDKVPVKPHRGCRCRIVPYEGK